MSDERLKPCPFCGGEAVIRYDNCNKAYIECKHGCVRTPSYWNNLVIIIETWNTRKPMERIVERLENELELADKEKERNARENPLQFDSVKGYATGIYNAIEIVKGGGEDE